MHKYPEEGNQVPACGIDYGVSSAVDSTRFEPLLLVVLSKRIESIIREMTNTVMKASRSSVIKNARDLSCGILTYDNRLVAVEEALPIHVTALELTTKPIVELFSDIREGDAFLNNSPFYGGTHHADLTVCVPVFFEGEPLFWTLARSHHADIGAPEPTSYLPYAKTIYEEGMHFPCVRCQQDFADKAEIIRMATQKIRVSHIWFGDYRAQVGACRIGERRLRELVQQHGAAAVRAFIEAWMDYGCRRATDAIRALPSGTLTYSVRHDPVPGVADEGIPIQVTVRVDSEQGIITVDARDNPDCVEGGLNLSEACATAACRIGVFNNLDSTIPHNHGSASRIVPLLRDGCVVGRAQHPVGTSCSTSNCMERLANAVQCSFAQYGKPYGMAEGGGNFSAAVGVISGVDHRTSQPMEYINQFMIALSGGGASYGYDGWLTYEAASGNGIMVCDSVEVDEAMYPILFEERRIAIDTMGFGEWCGAPATGGAYRSLTGDILVYYCGDGGTFPAKGVLGGLAGATCGTWKRSADGVLRRLPDFHNERFREDEVVVYRSCGGGGYGDPLLRHPELVVQDVNRKWLSPEKAESVFGVAVMLAANGVDYLVDYQLTGSLRIRQGA